MTSHFNQFFYKCVILAVLSLTLMACNEASVKSYVLDADGLLAHKQTDQAIVLYQKGIKEHPYASVLYLNQALLLRQTQQYPHAARNYLAVKKINPESFWSYLGLGRVYRLQEKYDKAIEILREGLKILPGHASLLYQMGRVYYAMAAGEEALFYFEKALDARYKHMHKIYLYRGLTFEHLLKNVERAKLDYQSYLLSDHPDDKTKVQQMFDALDAKNLEF